MKKKLMWIAIGLAAAAAFVVWVAWPSKPPEKYAPAGFSNFITPLFEGEEDQYEMLDENKQDVTQQVKEAVRQAVEEKDWNEAAEIAFSMAKSMRYLQEPYGNGQSTTQPAIFAQELRRRDDPSQSYWVVWDAHVKVSHDQEGMIDKNTSEFGIGTVAASPGGRMEKCGGDMLRVSPDRTSASIVVWMQVGDQSGIMDWGNLSEQAQGKIEVRPIVKK